MGNVVALRLRNLSVGPPESLYKIWTHQSVPVIPVLGRQRSLGLVWLACLHQVQSRTLSPKVESSGGRQLMSASALRASPNTGTQNAHAYI